MWGAISGKVRPPSASQNQLHRQPLHLLLVALHSEEGVPCSRSQAQKLNRRLRHPRLSLGPGISCCQAGRVVCLGKHAEEVHARGEPFTKLHVLPLSK